MWPWYRFADSISMIVISMKEKRTPNRYRGSCDNLVPAGDETLNCIILRNGGAIMARHSHKFSIADDDAVRALVEKLADGGKHQQRREKLLRALDDATRHYKDSNQKVRQASFHGLLAGCAVALKLW
jgi:hypothetical protein